MKQRGFTLLELIIVIATIGILAVIVLASVDTTRRNARNKAVISQMYEYQKAIELYYSDEGRYPPAGSPRTQRYCFGEGAVNGQCLANYGFYSAGQVGSINSAFSRYSSVLPRFYPDGSYGNSSPGFSGCAGTGIEGQITDLSCRESDYSIWFLLEGINADCGGRAYRTINTGNYSLCRLSSR